MIEKKELRDEILGELEAFGLFFFIIKTGYDRWDINEYWQVIPVYRLIFPCYMLMFYMKGMLTMCEWTSLCVKSIYIEMRIFQCVCMNIELSGEHVTFYSFSIVV